MAGFSGDSQWVVAPDNEGIRIWHIESGTESLFLPVFAEAAWINASGTELLANGNGAIRRWLLTPAADHKLRASEVENLGPASIFGKLAASTDGAVIGWIDRAEVKLVSHGEKRSWRHGQEMAEVIAMSPNGRLVAVGTRNHLGARVFDAAQGRFLWETGVGHGTHLSFSADSQWLGVGTDHGFYVFSADSGKLRWRHVPRPGEEPSFWEAAFSPDGAFVAWTPNPSQVQILNATDGSEVLTLDYPSRRYITRLAFSPDGRWLAETSNEHSLHLWDLHELRHQLDGFGLGW
jgi:WD40 repeat protein